LCIHDARNFDEYTQVLAGDTTNKMAFWGGEEAGWWFSSGTAVSSTNNRNIVENGFKHHNHNPYHY
jgi:hypothetical protein